MGLPMLPEIAQCIIEFILIIILLFLILQNAHYKRLFRQKASKLRIYLIFILFSICICDLVISTIRGIFPMINFIIRSFLIIFLSRNLREQWIKLVKILYLTRNLIFILFLDIAFFSIIGHLIFTSNDFSTLFSSIDNMLVMLTTNNFPDVMLKTFPQSKLSIFFFIPYMLISYIIILALLKALYYANYYEINKEEVLYFLNEVSGNQLFNNQGSSSPKRSDKWDKNEAHFENIFDDSFRIISEDKGNHNANGSSKAVVKDNSSNNNNNIEVNKKKESIEEVESSINNNKENFDNKDYKDDNKNINSINIDSRNKSKSHSYSCNNSNNNAQEHLACQSDRNLSVSLSLHIQENNAKIDNISNIPFPNSEGEESKKSNTKIPGNSRGDDSNNNNNNNKNYYNNNVIPNEQKTSQGESKYIKRFNTYDMAANEKENAMVNKKEDNLYIPQVNLLSDNYKVASMECLISPENISDKERNELYSYLKIIHSNFSLTKKETKVIKKIIYLASEQYQETKLSRQLEKENQKIFNGDNNNYYNNFSASQVNQIRENLQNLHMLHNFSSMPSKIISENSSLEEQPRQDDKSHYLAIAAASAAKNHKKDKQFKAEKPYSEQQKELNKFLLMENENIFSENSFLNITRSRYIEIAVNVLNICSILLLYLEIKIYYFYIITFVINISFCIFFIYEFIQLRKYLSSAQLLRKHILRCLFLVINILGLISNSLFFTCKFAVTLKIASEAFLKSDGFVLIKKISESLVLLRAVRIFILLNKFKEFYTIFTTIHNLRSIFSSVIFTLVSFCFIFTTISMLLFGGKVDIYRFKDHPLIPENYYNLNFNDYGSGFLFCFAMIVINNMNNIFDDLSLIYGQYMKLYFSIFFFLGIILIVNITQMLVLEMYLNIKDAYSTLSGEKHFSSRNRVK